MGHTTGFAPQHLLSQGVTSYTVRCYPDSKAMTDADNTEMAEEKRADNRQAHVGASISAKLVRGTEVRNQDTLKIKGKGATAEEAGQDFEQSLQMAEEQGWSDRLRALQPEEPTEESEE